MSSNEKPNQTRSEPIPIGMHNRSRSLSVSSSSESASSSSTNPQTPPSPPKNLISTSPILSYFISQSPTTKTPTSPTFPNLPFKRKFGTAPVLGDCKVDEGGNEIPVATHARRASATVANRFSQSQSPTTLGPFPDPQRGTNLLNLGRRLSLSSGSFVKPQLDTTTQIPPSAPGSSAPPNTAVSPLEPNPFTIKRRSATINSDGKPRRVPSPMGERILKGHFDGFN